jgi:hypothetical protein
MKMRRFPIISPSESTGVTPMNGILKLRFLLAFLLFPALVFAQFDTAEVLGTARDTTHGVLVGVIVTLINQDTGIQAKTATDENGNYNFFNVKVGRYTITAELAGFTKFSTTDVGVNVNARQRVDITVPAARTTTRRCYSPGTATASTTQRQTPRSTAK